MNLRLLLLVLCLAGNVLLAMALVRPQRAGSATADSPASNPHLKQAVAAPATTTTATDAAAEGTTNAADFSWLQFTLGDYAQYIKDLRAFGTPEPQVREIVFGAIDATYRPRRGALMPPPKKRDDTKFWVRRNPFGGQARMTPEQKEQMRALRKEEADLVKSLFGPDIYEQIAKDAGGTGSDWMERQYGFLPKELREKVQEIEERMNDDKSEVYAQAQEDNDWQSQQSDLRKIEKKYRDELAKVLTPEQLFEWDLRHSQIADQIKNNELSAFDPTESEFRAAFKYQQVMDEVNPPRDPNSDTPNLTPEERQAAADKRKAAEAELAEALGTNRLAEFKLEQDYGNRSLIEAGVPKDSVFKLADIKKESDDAVRKIRRDKTLTPDQRADALTAIQNETQASVNGLLDDKQYKRYLNQGGYWLRNIAPPKPQPVPAP
ncbi:MAG: hypothetical protein P4N60_24440 [Verrucomicrobiae bacterium]|nr:hypothetical protein [Verrucomicrobiae bacterium]